MSLFAIVLTAFLATILVAVQAENVALPTSVKTCKKDSDDYASCLRLAIQESWPTFVEGIPELDVPSLDPFVIDFQEHDYQIGEARGKLVVKNVNCYGLAKARFLSVKPRHHDGRFSLKVDFEMPKVFIEGEFKAEGNIGTLKMGGKGPFNVSMEDVRITWEIEGPVVNDKWIIETFKLTPEFGKLKIWASDLFNGNKELTKAALGFANEYWPVLYRAMLPYTSEACGSYFRDFVGNIFSKLSFAEIFP